MAIDYNQKQYDYYQKINRMYSNPERTMSEINDAGLQILRLHDMWREARRHRESGQLIKWRWVLDSCAVELNNDALRIDDENKKKFAFIKAINNVDGEISKTVTRRDYFELYRLLLSKEKILRQVQEHAGKGSKLRSEEDDWM